MARQPRLVIPGETHYVVQQALAGQPAFRDQDDYKTYLDWLRLASRQFKVAIHAYALLPEEVHLLLTPGEGSALGQMMQWIGRQYVPYYNARYQRGGTLWQGRYRATAIEAQTHLLACCRFLETAPVRHGLCASPSDYPWSTCRHHVGLQSDAAVTDHPLYWGLGNTPFEREAIYRSITEQALTSAEISLLDSALRKGWPLGSEAFKTRLEKESERRVRPAQRGRPKKRETEPTAG